MLRGRMDRAKFDCNLDDDQLYNRIYGAWLGRAAGCALGKPVEGWPKARIDGYLAEMGIEQLDDYIPFHEKKIPSILKTSTRGNIAYMDRDDDMDFPILGLLALERKGHDFSARTMAHIWLEYMPFSTLYTAENVAYRNFVMSLCHRSRRAFVTRSESGSAPRFVQISSVMLRRVILKKLRI